MFQKTATQQPEKEDLEQERVRACEKVRERERERVKEKVGGVDKRLIVPVKEWGGGKSILLSDRERGVGMGRRERERLG